MLKRLIPAVSFVCATAIAVASETPPAVDAMDCDQMRAELIAAGQKMSKQMDPEFAKEAKAMHDEAQAASDAGSVAQGVGMSIACSIPGVSMFCMATQQMQAMAQGAQAQQNIERMQKQMERLEKAMEGLDLERMTALSQRFEEKKCEVPQQ